MPAPCFVAWNNATGALTAPPTAQATAAASGTVRTMLQIATAANVQIRVVEWGYALSGVTAAPLAIELIETGAVGASSLTAHVAAGIHPVNVPTGAASTVQLGAALTGYAAAAPTEGSITSTRLFDIHWENGLYVSKQYPLGREYEVAGSRFLRIRATPTSAAAANMICYVAWEE